MKNRTIENTTETRAWDDGYGERLHRRHRRGDNWLNGLRIVARLLDIVSSYHSHLARFYLTYRSSGSIAMMSINLSKYYQTINVHNGAQVLWSSSTITWPNFLSLVSSAVTWIGAAVVLLSYCRGRSYAEKMDNRRSNTVSKVAFVLGIAAALTSALAMFKTRNNSNSLSGQTCGAPDWKVPMFPNFNFNKFCLMQVIYPTSCRIYYLPS
jgi:hypothetical protein